MGKDLYATFASARKVFDEADDALGGGLKKLAFEGQQVTLMLLDGHFSSNDLSLTLMHITKEKLKLTENAQPAILTTSMAILRVLEVSTIFNVEGTQYIIYNFHT